MRNVYKDAKVSLTRVHTLLRDTDQYESNVAALLGDSNFPNTLYSSSKGGKILQYQGLYKQYSNLGLTNPWDRPIAIEGLQRRLLNTMSVRGGYGIFDEGDTRGLLRRSLLWCRDPIIPKLLRIQFPTEREPMPSWSWMAYWGGRNSPGGIDYLELDFDTWSWEDLQSPWSCVAEDENEEETKDKSALGEAYALLRNDKSDVKSTSVPSRAKYVLVAYAREMDLNAVHDGDGDLFFDNPDEAPLKRTMCVVLGRAKGTRTPAKEQKNCVLVVSPTGEKSNDGKDIYERVGVGILPRMCIAEKGFKVEIQ
jgi:hypothetical protein